VPVVMAPIVPAVMMIVAPALHVGARLSHF